MSSSRTSMFSLTEFESIGQGRGGYLFLERCTLFSSTRFARCFSSKRETLKQEGGRGGGVRNFAFHTNVMMQTHRYCS
jgi:hypothetical protein